MNSPARSAARPRTRRSVGRLLFPGSVLVLGVAALLVGTLDGSLAGGLIGASFLLAALLMGGAVLAAGRMQHRIMDQIGSVVRTALPEQDESLRETGAPGRAVVLALADTGTSINDNPVVRFSVRIGPDDGSPHFPAEFTRLVSRISVPRKGDHCPVRYDPADRSRVLPIGPFTNEPMPAKPEAGSPQS